MPLNLNNPIAWTQADADEQAMLADLQGNILKGHGRHATLNLFLQLGDDPALARLTVRRLGALTVSALDQLHAAETHKRTLAARLPAGATPTFFTVMLTASGYQALDHVPAPNGGAAFRDGMIGRADLLNDGAPDDGWRQRIDVLVLIGDDPDADDAWQSARLDAAETMVANIITPLGARVVLREPGRAIFKTVAGSPVGIEHFGYVDGTSQPLFLQEQVDAEPHAIWNPAFPPAQVLVSDPGSAGARGFGSFFVFRKLEQNVRQFKLDEKALGDDDEHLPKLGELAGAMLVGRFEDGTPVTGADEEAGEVPTPNDFDYREDMAGERCPFHAHIRKVNPRGDSERLGFGSVEDERSHIMARRGITYGRRDQVLDPAGEGPAAPTDDVGLLFMAYQRDIESQFEFTQQRWANNPAFAPGIADPSVIVGRDPIIGQRGDHDAVPLQVRRSWNDSAATVTPTPFDQHVTFKGGGYFFAPARSTLLSL